MITSRNFACASEAQAFGLALRARGIEPQVRVNPARPEQLGLRPDSGPAEAALASGTDAERAALQWAKESCWWGKDGDLRHAFACLTLDLDEGVTNHADSYEAAEAHLDLIAAALAAAPHVTYVEREAAPASWDLVWDEPIAPSPDTDSDDVWGASVGSNGWLCD